MCTAATCGSFSRACSTSHALSGILEILRVEPHQQHGGVGIRRVLGEQGFELFSASAKCPGRAQPRGLVQRLHYAAVVLLHAQKFQRRLQRGQVNLAGFFQLFAELDRLVPAVMMDEVGDRVLVTLRFFQVQLLHVMQRGVQKSQEAVGEQLRKWRCAGRRRCRRGR